MFLFLNDVLCNKRWYTNLKQLKKTKIHTRLSMHFIKILLYDAGQHHYDNQNFSCKIGFSHFIVQMESKISGTDTTSLEKSGLKFDNIYSFFIFKIFSS